MTPGLAWCSFRWRVGAGAAAFLLALLVAPAAPLVAQVDLSIDPAMTRGPADAPVVIVEFLDYQ